MISSGRIASDHHAASAAPGASTTMRSTGGGGGKKPFDPRGSHPPPTGAGPGDEAPQLMETGAVPAAVCPRLNELMLVALALLYASFVGPLSLMSLAYFVCALVALPMCIYAAWIPPQARRGLCIGLACVSVAFLLLQTCMLAVARVSRGPLNGGTRTVVELMGIEESGPVSFRALSFLTRDLAVLIASACALHILRRAEERGQQASWRRQALSSPVRILPKASFLDCNWRMLTLGVLIGSSLVYPSLLSLPYYLAYLATLTAWTFDAFPLSSPAASERRMTSARNGLLATGTGGLSSRNVRPLGAFGRGWEMTLAASGAVYTSLYLLLVYVLQIPAIAQRLDTGVIRDYGAMSMVRASDRHLAVFAFHVMGISLLYVVAAAVVASTALEQRRLQQLPAPPRGRRRSTMADTAATTTTASAALQLQQRVGSASPVVGEEQQQQRERRQDVLGLVSDSEEEDGEGDEEDGKEDEEEHHPLHEAVKDFAQWFVARYGLYLCFLVYIILALERPTVLGFVFMLFVMVGAVLPGLIFRSYAPILLVYTGCYAAAVYWFGAVALRNDFFPPEAERRLGAIGLVPMDPFSDGWLIAGVPLFMTTLLGFTWHYRKTDLQTEEAAVAPAPAVSSPEPIVAAAAGAAAVAPAAAAAAVHGNDDVVTKILGPVEWLTYLENYLVAHDIGLYLCLNIAFAVGVSFLDLLHFPFIALASLIIVVPTAAPYLWGLAVGYAQCFILYLYWTHYKDNDAGDLPTSFGQAMALPVVFFVFGCRQFAVYLSSWRQGGRCWAWFGRQRRRRHHARHEGGDREHGAANDNDRLSLRHHQHQHHGHHRHGHRQQQRRRPVSSARPNSRSLRATQAVNVSLYLTKIVLRMGLIGVMWHMTFHTPLTIFSLGYLALLGSVPLAFLWARSFQKTSRDDFPRLFRATSLYAGLVTCTLHVFCAQNVSGPAIDRYVGVGLQEHSTMLILINWAIQLLAASQTDILRQQAVSLEDQLEAYPLFLHALKQVLPFTLLIAIFGIAWEHLSLFGAGVLFLGILNTALGRRVHAAWRLMVLLTLALALAIMAFDMQPLERYAGSSTLYWVGLRRGDYVPDPDAPKGSPTPPEAQGWVLSPSAEAYLIVAFLAALQFFYNTGEGDGELRPQSPELQQQLAVSSHKTVTFASAQGEATTGVDGAGQGQEEDAAMPAAADAAVVPVPALEGPQHTQQDDDDDEEEEERPAPDIIDNTEAIASGVTTLIEMLYNGKIAGGDDAGQPQEEGDGAEGLPPIAEDSAATGPAADHTSAPPSSPLAVRSPSPLLGSASPTEQAGQAPQHHHQAPDSPPSAIAHHAAATAGAAAATTTGGVGRRGSSTTSRLPRPSRRPWSVLRGVYRILHRAVLTLLATGAAFSFELMVVLTVVAALCHANLVSFLYLALFGLLVGLPRSTLRRRWRLVIHGLALLVLAEYMFILRLPPSFSYESQTAAQLLGSRQCSIFASHTPADEQQGTYTYGQWFGLCITEDALVLLDSVCLVLAIIQKKRFRADKLRVERPLLAPFVFERPSPLQRPEPAPKMDLARYLVLQYGAYLTVIVIFILSTLTFNLLSLGYILLIALMVQTHAQEGLLTARRFMWTPLAAYAWLCLVLRLLFQLPDWRASAATDSPAVLLGLRKVHQNSFGAAPDYPAEMTFDAVILILIVLQRRVFLSPDFQRVVDELWFAEQFDYVAHGSHVVNQLEKIREDALAAIRTQIRSMYEQLETVARARMEEADNKSWEHFLLKNRNAARDSISGNSPRPGGSPTGRGSGSGLVEEEQEDGVGGVEEEEEERRPLLQQRSLQPAAPQQQPEASPRGESERDPLLLQQQPSMQPSPSLDLQRRVGSDGEFTGRTGTINFSLTHSPSMLGDTTGGGLRMTASYDDRTQTRRLGHTGELAATPTFRPGSGGGGGGGSITTTPSTLRTSSARTRSGANEPPAGLTQWVSDALKQSSILEMRDPLNITDADVAAAAASHRPPTPVLECAQRRSTLYSPVFTSMELDAAGQDGEPPLVYRTDTVGGLSSTSASSLALQSPPAIAPDAADATRATAATPVSGATREGSGRVAAVAGGAGAEVEQAPAAAAPRKSTAVSKVSRFEQLVLQSFEEVKKRSTGAGNGVGGAAGAGKTGGWRWAARGRRAWLRLMRNVVMVMNSRSTSMVYTVLVIAHMYEPSLLNMVYPISVFGYAILQNPRSLPRINNALMHPMIQNPPRYFWHFLLGYAFLMLVLKFVYQFPFFCTCANAYSYGTRCPSSLMAYEEVCTLKSHPHLDYYIEQPIVTDYFLGVFKAFHALPWNQMSVRYEPVDRYLPPDIPGQASETTLDSGLGGAFLVSYLGDFLVLLAVLWHAHVLRTRGVWLSRDPDFLTAAASSTPYVTAGASPAAAVAGAAGSGESCGTPRSSSPAGKPKTVKAKKARRPLSWSPSLYRKRLASPNAAAAGAAVVAPAPPTPMGSGGGGGATPLVPSSGQELAAAGGEVEGHGQEQEQTQEQERPDSTRSTTSTGTNASRFSRGLARGESIATLTSTTRTTATTASSTSTSSSGAPRSCLARAFGPFFDQARAKPGSDLYVTLFFIQCLLFLFVLFAYQHADHLVQSVRENQLAGGYVLVLLLHFILIVVDRIIYLHRSIRGKLIQQWVLLVAIFCLIHSNYTFRIGISQHGPLLAWYIIMCAYLFVSGLQISYGYPPFIQTNWMTRRAHHFWGNIFKLYRSLPFLYELRMLLDWACTPTTLYLGEWIKLEDIYCGLFIQECNLHFLHTENRRKGDRQPVRRKVLCGFVFFALLNLLVWLPLFVFSTGSFSQFDNSVAAGSLSVQLNGFPMLYEAASADYISPILPTETWSLLAQTNPALALLPATSTNDYMRELQFVRLPRSSQELWKISPPAQEELMAILSGDVSNSNNDTANGNAGASVAAKPAVEMTLRFSFGTQDGSINDGMIVHALSAEERRGMADIIAGNRTALRLQGVLPSIIRISTTKEVNPLLASGDIQSDCVLTFTKLGDEAADATTTTTPLTAAMGWWDFTCGSAADGCSTALEPQGAASATVEVDPVTGQPEEGCNPSVYTISSEKTIGSFFLLSYGIIGLYFTVVLAIGRFVHMSVMNKKYAIICDDLPRVEVLKELCETIYLARMYKNLALEEELYRELIDVYRRPQLIYQRTGPYRHWLREGDEDGEGQNYYDQQVERELRRYR